jgi:hypothetical protein
MVAVPTSTAVTRPTVSTMATVGALLDQVTALFEAKTGHTPADRALSWPI